MKKYWLLIQTFSFFIFLAHLSLAETNFEVFFKNKDKYKDVVVTEVLSTDTIVLQSEEKIRLIGLRTPDNLKKHKSMKLDDKGNPVEEPKDKEEIAITPIEEEALKFVTDLLLKKHVRLEFDDQKKSDDYVTFAYVYLLPDNLMVNTEILRRGYAHLQIIPPNMKYADSLRAAYREAKKERRGLQND